LEDAVIMATDVLESRIEVALERGETLPSPSDVDTLSGDKVMLIVADVENIKSQTRYVKKTLSIPHWLNVAAEKEHINFSGVLQEALKVIIQYIGGDCDGKRLFGNPHHYGKRRGFSRRRLCQSYQRTRAGALRTDYR
jgi:hypothetical protein